MDPPADRPAGAESAHRAAPTTVAGALVDGFAALGTARLFGVPGGGSSLDLIEAARARGLAFVLARQESAAVLMAATTAELDGSLGVALTTQGPGTASAANGVAHAHLDRCAVAVISDALPPAHRPYVTHQRFDQRALLGPLTAAHATFDGGAVGPELARLAAAAFGPPAGPVHVELDGATARAAADPQPPRGRSPDRRTADPAAVGRAVALLRAARRPLILAGLEAAAPDAAAALRRLLAALDCPALVTYKAKGVVPDADTRMAGVFTGGAAERPVVSSADLVLLAGVDPVELIPQPWAFDGPVIDVAAFERPMHYLRPDAVLAGPVAAGLEALAAASRPATGWAAGEAAARRAAMHAALACPARPGALGPEAAVRIAARVAGGLPRWPRATVDAGAHMFSATTFWPCSEPRDLLISNGLATMGFALPAAIASVLHDPTRPTIAFTGDGGLLMGLGELVTAVETGGPLVIVVFNDGALSLIDVKQQQRALAPVGVRWGPAVDFAAVMRGLGGGGWRAGTPADYERALHEAFASGRPSLIDAAIDPSGYPAQLAALRG
jgi:acetolactate synthase-1/2/3 large subunit